MEFREQEYILELNRCRSITRAAEALHVTQPTLSIFLSKLEKNLGAVLFERVGKKLVPTEAGRSYVAHAAEMQVLRNEFEMELLDIVKGLKGRLYIGCQKKRSHFLMPRIFRLYQERHPEIEPLLFSDYPEVLFEKLRDGSLDLAVISSFSPPEGFACTELSSDHLILVLPEGHPASSASKPGANGGSPFLDLNCLSQETFFLMEKGRTVRRLADSAFSYCGFTPKRIRTMDTIDLCCQMAAEGLGAAFTMESYASDFRYPRPVSFYSAGDPELRMKWYAVWRTSTELTSYMADFLDLLKAEK